MFRVISAVSSSPASPLEAFQWERQPEAERFVRGLVDDFLNRVPDAAALALRMREQTGTRFFDWIDSITLTRSDENEQRVRAAGYERAPSGESVSVFRHHAGMFPTIVLDPRVTSDVALKVESVADFAAANGLVLSAAEPPLSRLRRALIASADGARLWAIERHGCRDFFPEADDPQHRLARLKHMERFRTRRRDCSTDAEGFEHANALADEAIAEVGVDLACDLFFTAEREYWQRRNRAAQFQKSRQDGLGLGWANHDHHTYRSSRQHFARLISFFEKLGFACRERFYAGREAGWGAQILEQSTAGIVIFADVDLAPEELFNDFAHEPLPPRDSLGTVGLWCGLHGESFLQAGMHHLECQFDFNALCRQMEAGGVKVMKPFTDFTYLRQAFTEGERWPVREQRLAALLSAALITPEQAAQFRQNGAIGSHLENLERNQGFKGFNQKGVSEIIAATDPRKH